VEEIMGKNQLVLAAIDLEAGTDLALDTAIGMASAATSTQLVVLHVFEPLVGMEFDALTGVDPKKKIETIRSRTEAALHRFADTHPQARLPAADIHVTIGRPADEIVWAAAHFDVEAVVLASHGRRGLNRLLLGSVAEKVVRLAGCPVIVARAKHHDPRAKLPDIEPLCEDCAKVRAETLGGKLWCERHATHHGRAHTYSSAGRVEAPPAWGAATGS
jgi:nucleotide-binding universal stress UspA family protein